MDSLTNGIKSLESIHNDIVAKSVKIRTKEMLARFSELNSFCHSELCLRMIRDYSTTVPFAILLRCYDKSDLIYEILSREFD
jgi:hypothetical protein